MKLLTFKGGIHPPYRKEYTEKKALERAKSPKVVYIPLQQHIGASATPIVKVGDEVKLGQKIGEKQGFVSSNVHSSVSGKVIGIESYWIKIQEKDSMRIVNGAMVRDIKIIV